MSRRGQTNDKDPAMWIPESGYGATPVNVITIGTAFDGGNLFSPGYQPRAKRTVSDGGFQRTPGVAIEAVD